MHFHVVQSAIIGSYMQQVSWKTMMETKVMRQHAISERVGIHMYDMLINLGAKEDATNYYKDTLRDIIEHYDTVYTLTRRTHNKNFLNHVWNSLNM